MSSTAITSATADVGTLAETVEKAEKPARKFPAPCWTQEETLALIDAYREKWYALRRGYLRTADWEAVVEAVSARFPDASPPKTSAQCRHKMEKLRQRYRAEKQRSLSYPYPAGKFFSSWFFFEKMDAMENGLDQKQPDGSPDGTQLKPPFPDHSVLKLKLNPKNNTISSQDVGLANGIKGKSSTLKAKVSSNSYSPYLDMGEEEENDDYEDQGGFGPVKFNPNSSGGYFGEMNNAFDVSRGFHVKSSGNRNNMSQSGVRLPKFGQVKRMDSRFGTDKNGNEEFWGQGSLKHLSGSRRYKNGVKVERDPVDEMVESIKLLGDGYVKMEKAKMDMAMEMEATRMEMEMKRNEMMLESQRQIVDAFVKGLFELKKNKKVKTAVVAQAEDS